ncbi:MAG: hypothetical protein C1941_05075 [Prosthecochloris sp.]|nr:hypothetical protein [Prosthecochloris sp.]
MDEKKIQSNGVAADTTVCPACGKLFTCSRSENCWCATINVPVDVRKYLAMRYESCLCRSCLEKLIHEPGSGKQK